MQRASVKFYRYPKKHSKNNKQVLRKSSRLVKKGFKRPRRHSYLKLFRPAAPRLQVRVNSRRARQALSIVGAHTVHEIQRLRRLSSFTRRAPRATVPALTSAYRTFTAVVRKGLIRRSSRRLALHKSASCAIRCVARTRTTLPNLSFGFRSHFLYRRRDTRASKRHRAFKLVTARVQHLLQFARRYSRVNRLSARICAKRGQLRARLKMRFRAKRLAIRLPRQRHSRQGKGAYAGLMGKIRWRRERRDRVLLRRAFKARAQKYIACAAARLQYRNLLSDRFTYTRALRVSQMVTRDCDFVRMNLRRRLAVVSTRKARRHLSFFRKVSWRKRRPKRFRTARQVRKQRAPAKYIYVGSKSSQNIKRTRLAAAYARLNAARAYSFVGALQIKPQRTGRIVTRLTIVPNRVMKKPRRRFEGSHIPEGLRWSPRLRHRTIFHLQRARTQRTLSATLQRPDKTVRTFRGTSEEASLPALGRLTSRSDTSVVAGPTSAFFGPGTHGTFLANFSRARVVDRRNCEHTPSYQLLRTRRQQYRALRFYVNRPRLRLPQTTVTRRRRRRGGLGLFSQHSLKKPQTLAGAVRQLLPPARHASHLRTAMFVGGASSVSDLVATQQYIDVKPRIWKRPHSWKNLRAVYYVRRRRYAQQKRYERKLQAYASGYRRAPINLSTASTASALPWNIPSGTRAGKGLASLDLRSTGEQAVRSSMRRHTISRVTSSLVRTTDLGVIGDAVSNNSVKKTRSTWYARSVRAMQRAERSDTAWSPQYQLRWRRRSYPRINGVPVRRRQLGFKAMRARAQQNAALAFRGLPQKRYLDLNYIKLQFYLGSVASLGYARLRRTHRFKSNYGRWWRPTKYATPFAHPFSRRALTAKKFHRKQLLSADVPSRHDYSGAMSKLPSRGLKRKLPGRSIPWRNFHYRKPRHKPAPYTLQRWAYITTSGRTAIARAKATALVLAETPRALRSLETYMPQRNVWKARQWEFLENQKLPVDKLHIISKAIAAVPPAVWSALREQAGSLSNYMAVRSAVLLGFRRWVSTSPQTTNESTAIAKDFLLRSLHGAVAGAADFLPSQYRLYRMNAFSRKVSAKRDAFWLSRVLPQFATASKSLTSRENGASYKRWLRGAEQLLHRGRRGYLPASRSRYTTNSAVEFGRARLRFPASGRRRRSFDSMLHAFAKRISPSRIRRTASLRYKRAKLTSTTDFRENALTGVSSAALQRRSRFARKINGSAYLSPVWRELLSYRAASTNDGLSSSRLLVPGVGKRRFASAPFRRLLRAARIVAVRQQPMYKNQLRAIRRGVLRRALRRRRDERVFADLRKAALQRKLPRERAALHWKVRRAARRKRSARLGPWSRRALDAREVLEVGWGLRHLGVTAPRVESLRARILNTLPSGESLTPVFSATRRKARAKRVFGVRPFYKRAKGRPQTRDSIKRRRRNSRRRRLAGPTAAMRQINHWSEQKSFTGVGFLPLAKQLLFSKKFFAPTKRLYGARLGSGRLPSLAMATFRAKASSARVDVHRAHRGQVFQQSLGSIAVPTLCRFTSLTRKKRRTKFHKRRIARITHHRRKSALRQVQRVRKPRRSRRVCKESSVLRQLVTQVGISTLASPLYFQKPTVHVVKTEKAKEDAIIALISAKEARYKPTAQYVESLTSFIPELINAMLSQRVRNNSQLPYSQAQQIIRNVYWSLRVYLNVDPFDARFALRDKKPAARLLLSEEISALAKEQITNQLQRAGLRYRFQPGRLLLAPNTMRFRNDWLRNFLPTKHALYQEDPDDYGMFLIKTSKIRRLRMHGRGIADWVTTQQRVGHETRARQLLTLRYSKARPRLETLLQTTRRVAQKESLAVTTLMAPRATFFARSFSTETKAATLVTKLVGHKKRFISFDDKWRTVSPLVAVRSRSRVLPRIEARGRTNYIASSWPAISGTMLDTRFSRSKSPRSRQYVLRQPTGLLHPQRAISFCRVKALRALRHHRVPLLPSSPKTRSTRRVVYISPVDAVGSFPKRLPVPIARVQSNWRREVISLRAKQLQISQPALATGKTKFWAHRRILDTIPAANSWRVLQERVGQFSSKTLRSPRVSIEDRTFLHGRAASSRTISVNYRTPSILQPEVVELPPRVLKMQQKWYSLFRNRAKVYLRKTRRGLPSPRWSVTRPVKKSWLHFTRSGGVFPIRSKQLRLWFTPREWITRRHVPLKSIARYQVAHLGWLTRRCLRTVRLRKQAPFETYRSRLWDKLSLRWMKRYRVARYWIKDTSRWLRDPWLSAIVSCEPSVRADRFGGELRVREQQIGEYVPEVDSEGRDIPAADAPVRERHDFIRREAKADPAVRATEVALKVLSRATITKHRLAISKIVRRKPIPTMRLANYEYRDVIREHKEEVAKSPKQRAEEEQARVKAYWERKTAGVAEEKPRRLPLKHPSNLWLPNGIWKEIQRRVRKFEWRESDEVFFRRGFRSAFRFYPQERNSAPWLEALMYTRATYSTRLREFRRRQFPREQKKYKWLQRVRKSMFPTRYNRYFRKRKWPQLRRYNQKLHRSLFKLPTRRAARRHFKKLNRRSRPAVSNFASASQGLVNRVDNVILQLGLVPSIYWARIVAPFGLLRVNGTIVKHPSWLLSAGDHLQVDWDVVSRFQHFFKPFLRNREAFQQRNRASTSFYPTNIEYHRGTRTLLYTRPADEADFRKSSRIRGNYFRWFKLDSV